MRVVVVEMRATGIQLTEEELAEAKRHEGELFFDGMTAQLCGGPYPDGWPNHGMLLPMLQSARIKRIHGDEFMIVGEVYPDMIRLHTGPHPQAWWCRLVHEPSQAVPRNRR
jgi:hypothetical protein